MVRFMVCGSLTLRTVVYILIPCSTFRETKLSACASTSVCPSPTVDSIATRHSVLSNDVWDPWATERQCEREKEKVVVLKGEG